MITNVQHINRSIRTVFSYICWMRRFTEIAGSSFRLALLELGKNKLRTFLSLFGITIGIFCIIGVLTTVNSLERNLQAEIQSLGTNTIYIDKWQYSAGPDFPYWKYAQRPSPRYAEMDEIMQRTPTAKFTAFKIHTTGNIEAGSSVAANIRLYGISEDFDDIQPMEIGAGRFISDAEFYRGTNTAVVGHSLAENLFGSPEAALQKTIVTRGQQVRIVGVVKKQGTQLIGGWGFDESVIMPYRFARTIMNEQKADPLIMVQGKDGISSKVLQDDLKGAMRAVRKLRPAQEDNFSLNDVAEFSEVMSKAFVSVNLGGWIIGALSFVVGIFGVANIMFVSVRERTSQIGLKKALGAKKTVILLELLLESALLCVIGGLVGLLLIFVLTKVAMAAFGFPLFLSPGVISTAVLICIAAGITAGIIPAYRAAAMNPATAIRS